MDAADVGTGAVSRERGRRVVAGKHEWNYSVSSREPSYKRWNTSEPTSMAMISASGQTTPPGAGCFASRSQRDKYPGGLKHCKVMTLKWNIELGGAITILIFCPSDPVQSWCCYCDRMEQGEAQWQQDLQAEMATVRLEVSSEVTEAKFKQQQAQGKELAAWYSWVDCCSLSYHLEPYSIFHP